MNSFRVSQFLMLQKKELWENRNLLIGAPVVMAIVVFVCNFLVVSQLNEDQLSLMVGFLLRWFEGENPFMTTSILTLFSLPFVIVFFFCSAKYLLNALYHDRRDMSILFWQSMPVSNMQTVFSKLITVVVVSPAFIVVVMGVLYLLTVIHLAVSAATIGAGFAGFFYMLAAAWINLIIVYFFLATSALWLLPLMGWLLLFSAFARRAPMLWAVGVFFALAFAEEFIFNSQFISVWAQTRLDPDNFLIVDFTGIWDRLFSYDMFVGWFLGGILITGSVYMRRYSD